MHHLTSLLKLLNKIREWSVNGKDKMSLLRKQIGEQGISFRVLLQKKKEADENDFNWMSDMYL